MANRKHDIIKKVTIPADYARQLILSIKDEFTERVDGILGSEEKSHRAMCDEYVANSESIRAELNKGGLDPDERGKLNEELHSNTEKLKEEVKEHRNFLEKMGEFIHNIFIVVLLAIAAAFGINISKDKGKCSAETR